MNELPVFHPSELTAVINQLFDTAISRVQVVGEVSNFRVSRGTWVYFDIKDEQSSLKCFMSVYQLSMPVMDGMVIEIVCRPSLHPLYNFSLTVESARPVGEGSIKKSTDALAQKLEAEGLFLDERKRPIPFAPEHVALITSGESAAYGDFMKIYTARWGYSQIELFDVLVQGEKSPEAIVAALQSINSRAHAPEVIVVTRGGGSADDLLAFSDERVVRAVAGSRIPVVAAIGHEQDISLTERTADLHASTPSNAAELIFPSKTEEKRLMSQSRIHIVEIVRHLLSQTASQLMHDRQRLAASFQNHIQRTAAVLSSDRNRLELYNPQRVLDQGYAIVTYQGRVVRRVRDISPKQSLAIRMGDGQLDVVATAIKQNERRNSQ